MFENVKRNKAYRHFFDSDKKYNILRGGSGSGKSFAVADDIINRTLDTSALSRTICTRKVAATLRQSVFKLLQMRLIEMGISDAFKINKTEMTFTYGKNEIILVGLDDVNKLKSIYNPTDAWLEEADQVSQSDFEEIDRRIRSITGRKPKITLSFNPTSIYSWIKKYFYDNVSLLDNDVYQLTTTYKDNHLLDPAYAKTIERLQETNPSAYRVYGLGEWGIVEGVVFDKWDTQEIPENAKLMGYGLDWGFTNDPTSLNAVWYRGNEVWFDEILYQTGLTNQDLSMLMTDAGLNRRDEIIADSSEPKSIEEMYRMGWNIHPAVKGADSIRSGIALMKSKIMHITPRSSNLQREFSSYCYRQDKNGNWLNEPIDMFNHGIDSLRYRLTMYNRQVKAGPKGLI